MIVQIYTAQTPEEGIALAEAGVDQIGVTPAARDLPGEISDATAAEIFYAVGDKAVKVALSVETELPKIYEMVTVVRPDVLHLCGDISIMTPERVAQLRAYLPAQKIMQAIPVVDEQALKIAEDFQTVADFLILDSFSTSIGGIGAAGFIHDWNISRKIVRNSHLPVILAGGLSPENVAEAIRSVHPWGVDSLTKTNVALGEGKFRKDLDRVRQFIQAAKQAEIDTHDQPQRARRKFDCN